MQAGRLSRCCAQFSLSSVGFQTVRRALRQHFHDLSPIAWWWQVSELEEYCRISASVFLGIEKVADHLDFLNARNRMGL